MLVLGRKIGEAIRIGNITVAVTNITRGTVHIGIDAPQDVHIVRQELLDNGVTHRCLGCGATVDLYPGNSLPRDTELCSHQWKQT